MRPTRLTVLVFSALLAAAAAARAEVRADVAVSASAYFYDSLAPQGEWLVNASYGDVWRPNHLEVGWRPYTDGYWVDTDYGWTFVSDDAYGWATYHYGRWFLDPYYGWVWVPATEWAPAWVAFYEEGDWVGWAPLAPGVDVQVAVNVSPPVDPRGCAFVERRHFLDRDLRRQVAPIDRNPGFVRQAKNVTRFERVSGTVVVRGPAVDRIARTLGRPVPRLRVRDLPGAQRKLPGPRLTQVPRVASRPGQPPPPPVAKAAPRQHAPAAPVVKPSPRVAPAPVVKPAPKAPKVTPRATDRPVAHPKPVARPAAKPTKPAPPATKPAPGAHHPEPGKPPAAKKPKPKEPHRPPGR